MSICSFHLRACVELGRIGRGMRDHPSRPDARRRSVLGFVSILGGSLALVLSASAWPALAPNYTTAASTAVVFAVHEIALVGSVTTANPFDVAVRVRFTPASGEKNAVAADAFHDGGSTWRERLIAQPVPGHPPLRGRARTVLSHYAFAY